MITSNNEITHLIDKKDYFKLRLYISLGYDLSLTDVNGDFVSKFGFTENTAFAAILSHNMSILKKLKSAILNAKNNCGYSSLHWAIILHNNDAVRFLIDSGVEIESKTSTNENVISLAARFNNTNAFFYLLKRNNRKMSNLIRAKNERGFTPLHFASANKNIKIITYILFNSMKNLIIERNIYGATSLHWLVHGMKLSDHAKLILLRNFCGKLSQNHNKKLIYDMLRARNALGLTPLDWLEMYHHSQSYQFLSEVE